MIRPLGQAPAKGRQGNPATSTTPGYDPFSGYTTAGDGLGGHKNDVYNPFEFYDPQAARENAGSNPNNTGAWSTGQHSQGAFVPSASQFQGGAHDAVMNDPLFMPSGSAQQVGRTPTSGETPQQGPNAYRYPGSEGWVASAPGAQR